MEDKVQKEEMLYRAIKRSKPEWLNDEGRPASYMFKDENGNSVDRDDNRPLIEIIQFMSDGVFKKRLKGVVEINAGKCMKIGTFVEASPTESNPYHANIVIDNNEVIGNLQALLLADASKVVYMNPIMKWIQT